MIDICTVCGIITIDEEYRKEITGNNLKGEENVVGKGKPLITHRPSRRKTNL